MSMRFPNESHEYRAARDRLLRSEVALRRQMEMVARELRGLPPGGAVPEDYLFERVGDDGAVEKVRLSALFGDGDTLMVYHFMFPRHSGDDRPRPATGIFHDRAPQVGPCPSCTALIDMWEGGMPHFEGLGGNLVIVAKAPITEVAEFAREKGWRHARLLSSAGTSFRRDYGGEDDAGEPVPIMTVFKRDEEGTIRLHWASELVHAPEDPGQDSRHLGTVEPVWTLFDLTPHGRPSGSELFDYPCCHPRSAAG